jgi:hypothetical protein
MKLIAALIASLVLVSTVGCSSATAPLTSEQDVQLTAATTTRLALVASPSDDAAHQLARGIRAVATEVIRVTKIEAITVRGLTDQVVKQLQGLGLSSRQLIAMHLLLTELRVRLGLPAVGDDLKLDVPLTDEQRSFIVAAAYGTIEATSPWPE